MQANQITPNNTQDTQPRRPANPPARFAFRQKKQQTRQTKGQEPKQQNPQKGFAKGHSGLYHCVTLKNMHKLIIHHDILWNIEIEALRVASLS